MPSSLDSPALDVLLQRPDLWRGAALARTALPVVASGHAALDAELPGGGWPRGELCELLAAAAGIGELSLLWPALRRLPATRPVAVVAPPYAAHAPGWAAALPGARLCFIQAAGADAAWSAEAVLASGAFQAVLAWLPALDARGVRRLQVVLGGRDTLAWLLRPPAAAREPSAAPLRLAVEAAATGLQVRLLKRRGPPLLDPLRLDIARPAAWPSALVPPARRPAPTHAVAGAALC